MCHQEPLAKPFLDPSSSRGAAFLLSGKPHRSPSSRLVNALRLAAAILLCGLAPARAAAPADTDPRPLGTPADAVLFQGRWYRVYFEKLPWRSAREACARLGGRLAMIKDQATQDFIAQMANGVELWLGATDEKVEGLWVWLDGSRVEFKNWDEWQPDNHSRREHYLQIWHRGKWNDAHNGAERVVGYVCQWERK